MYKEYEEYDQFDEDDYGEDKIEYGTCKCSSCGCLFDKDEAISEFESIRDGLSYIGDTPGDLCGACAVDYADEEYRSQPGYHEEDDPIYDEDYIDDGIPEGCAACGGDWPNCDDGSCSGGLNWDC